MKEAIFLIGLSLASSLTTVAQVTCDSITSPNFNDEDFSVLIANDGNYYMTWFNDSTGTPDIWIQRSQDKGHTWDSLWLAVSSPDNNWYPTLGQTSDDTYHLTWFQASADNGYLNVRYSQSENLFDWSTPQKITDNSNVDWVPNLLIDKDDKLWITWSSNQGNPNHLDIWQVNSSDNGASWSEAEQLTTDPNQDAMPYILQAQGGGYFMTWQRYSGDMFPYITPTSDIWLAVSGSGENWSKPDSITFDTDMQTVNVLPSIYEDKENDNIFINWTTSRHNPLGSIAEINYEEVEKGILGNEAAEINNCPGYFGRIYPADESGVFHMFWVGDRDSDEKRDIFHSLIEKEITVAIDEYKQTEKVIIFPNPMKSHSLIQIPDESAFVMIRVFDRLGQLIKESEIQHKKTIRLNKQSFTKGLHIVQFIGPDRQTQVVKLMIE